MRRRRRRRRRHHSYRSRCCTLHCIHESHIWNEWQITVKGIQQL